MVGLFVEAQGFWDPFLYAIWILFLRINFIVIVIVDGVKHYYVSHYKT